MSRDARPFYRTMALTAGAVVGAVHLPALLLGRYVNVDEGYASAIAERLEEGFRLYQGAVSQRGPLMYTFYEGLARVSDGTTCAPSGSRRCCLRWGTWGWSG